MPTCETTAIPLATYWPAHSPRHRFTIRADGGFLAACAGIGGTPIEVVRDHRSAVHFVDFQAAWNRACLMTEVGWTNLRVVEVRLD